MPEESRLQIPVYNKELWIKNVSLLIELLIASQLLFLNNFCEPVCKRAKQVLKVVLDHFRLDVDVLNVGQKVEGQSFPLVDRGDGRVELIKHHVTLLACAMFYNFGQMVMELFNEEQKHFSTFCFLVERVLPSSLNALESDGSVPYLSTYEVKLLVCGLSRAFFGRQNSVSIPVDSYTRSGAESTIKDSQKQSSKPPAPIPGSEESKLTGGSEKPSAVESNIGLPFHN